MISTFLIVIIFGAGISFLSTPLFRDYFIRRGWVENPAVKQKKTGNATALEPVPRGGGLPILLSIVISALVFIHPWDRKILGIMLASALTLAVGLADDIKDISPKIRIGFNILAGVVVVASGVGIAYLSNPMGGIVDFTGVKMGGILLADILAIGWIVWCMNIVGWSAGVEGQLPGFTALSAFFVGLLAFRYAQDMTQTGVIILSAAVSGAYLGYLPFNFFPQTTMPGYSGKSLAGFFLAVLAILSGAKLATVIFLLGIPMLDAIYVLTYRVIKHRSLLKPNSIHFHHYLLRSGWSRKSIAILYWFFSLALGVVSLFLNSQQKFYVFIGVAIIFFTTAFSLYRRTLMTPSR